MWLSCSLMGSSGLNNSDSVSSFPSPSHTHPSTHRALHPSISPSVIHSHRFCLTSSFSSLRLLRSTVTTPLPPPPSTSQSMRNPKTRSPQRVLSLALDTRHRDNFLGLLPWRLSGVQSVMVPLPPARSRLSLQETLQPSKWKRRTSRRGEAPAASPGPSSSWLRIKMCT